MLFHFLIILGCALLCAGLRSFPNFVAQKLATLGILATSFLTGWLLTGHWTVGLFCALSWLLLPWLEILTRVRRLTLPVEKNLRRKSPPRADVFPALGELTEEVELQQFESLEDCGWDSEDSQQFFRLFYKAEDRTQAAVCMVEQDGLAFCYLSLSSRASDGKIWTTWDYPFTYSLKLVPEWKMNLVQAGKSFEELYESHRAFLRSNGVTPGSLLVLDPGEISSEIQKDLRTQVEHNVEVGVLIQTASGEVRYSWRGLFFIWTQFLRDLLRPW